VFVRNPCRADAMLLSGWTAHLLGGSLKPACSRFQPCRKSNHVKPLGPAATRAMRSLLVKAFTRAARLCTKDHREVFEFAC